MTGGAPRRLRADAARNVEKIVRAAQETWAGQGPDAPLEDIALRAGVGIATLFRHFPDKVELALAVMDHGFNEDVAPVIERALNDEDPRRGLVAVLEAALVEASRQLNTYTVANAGTSPSRAALPFFDSLTLLADRAKEAGLVRGDLVAEDLLRIMVMLIGVLWTMERDSEGWRRYLALTLDGLAPHNQDPLPGVMPLPANEPALRFS
jgi:AcrR family transcriptional regulator